LLWSPWLPLLLAACHSPAPEPAPPPASYELTAAPPGARGARAAGTDAAPPPPGEGVLGEPEDDEDEAEPEPDAGTETEDGGAVPDAGGGVAL
jgi:hypothetical protein